MATVVTIATLPAAAGYNPTNVMVELSGTQAAKLDQIRRGLIADEALVSVGGRAVESAADALRYLIDTAAAAG